LPEQPETADTLLAEIETEIESSLADLRRVVYDLRPPALDQLGLVGALRAYAVACESGEVGDTQPKLTVHVEAADELPPLPAAVEVAAYHIGREAMANVVHHAGAATCAVRLSQERTENRRLVLSIRDDGAGMAQGVPAGVGLASMRERAAELGGTCTLESKPGAGTLVVAVLPLDT
jgi:signal transduction histidine kinase